MTIFTKLGIKIKEGINKAYRLIRSKSYIAVAVTQNLKKILDSNVPDILVALTGTNLDDKALAIARERLPVWAAKILIAHNLMEATEDPSTALVKLKLYLETLGDEGKAHWFVNFSASIKNDLTDGVFSWDEVTKRSQEVFQEFFKNKV
jgi:hypothetical protein